MHNSTLNRFRRSTYRLCVNDRIRFADHQSVLDLVPLCAVESVTDYPTVAAVLLLLHPLHTHTVCPGSSYPILYSNLLNKTSWTHGTFSQYSYILGQSDVSNITFLIHSYTMYNRSIFKREVMIFFIINQAFI